MKVPFITKSGNVEPMDIPDGIFDLPVRTDVVQRAVVWMQAAERRGTHHAKTRGEVRGGGKKPWAQKGTGRARHGSTRSPIWVGGGKSFGPRTHSHKQGLPKKMRKLAIQMALADKAQNGRFFVAEEIVPTTSKTKEMATMMKKWKEVTLPVLFLSTETHEALLRASRNLPTARVATWPAVSILEILRARSVVLAKNAADAVFAGMKSS